MAERKPYPSDLTDEQWELVQPVLARKGTWGRPRAVDQREVDLHEVDLHEVVNALLYLVRTGCPWDYLPHDFPHRSTARYYFDKWREDGTRQDLNDRLRRQVRIEAGRHPEPSAGIIDSQSVKTTEAGGERGFDGGKKVAGRKRQMLVDTLGNLLAVLVHSAGWSDAEGGAWLLFQRTLHLTTLLLIWADQTYRGDLVDDARVARPQVGDRRAPARGMRLHPLAETVGGGAATGLVQSQPAPQQRLREAARGQRSLDLRRLYPTHAQTLAPHFTCPPALRAAC